MTKFNRQKINKLFYGKWPYKIQCVLNRASLIIRLGPEEARKWANEAGKYDPNAPWYSSPYAPIEVKQELLKFLDQVEPFLTEDVQIRAEYSSFNIFCKDTALRNRMIRELKPWIYEVSEPANKEELEYMLSNGSKKVVCNALPHERFRYKIHFKSSMDADSRKKFLTWSENYRNMSISGTTHRWLIGAQHWAQDPFMYVEDSKTLSMVSLFLGNNIRTVEEYVPRSSINTSLDQEI